jgi:2-polyprenyl-3-methyl-5-hydroxy-6-metoxy-1,4-benzoquinol methylase
MTMDRERIEAFLAHFVGLASGATTIALLAVADRSGLLDWLREHGTGRAGEIAAGTSLQERYVVEILSGLTAAGVVEYDPSKEMFTLPAEHALFLADESSPYFMGGWLDMIPAVMAQVDRVATATRDGGGVPFDDFGPGLIRGIDRGNSPSQRVFLTRRWLPAVPGLVDRLEEGIEVADVGCGAGTAAILMAREYPKSRFHGYDVSSESISLARSRSDDLANVSFEEHPVAEIPTQPAYGLVTSFDVIHDLGDPMSGLVRIRQALAPDGQFLMMEPNVSSHLELNLNDRAALLYGISTMLCMTQSLAGGGAGLGAAWGRETAEEYAREAGFASFTPLDDITNKFSAFYLLTA